MQADFGPVKLRHNATGEWFGAEPSDWETAVCKHGLQGALQMFGADEKADKPAGIRPALIVGKFEDDTGMHLHVLPGYPIDPSEDV